MPEFPRRRLLDRLGSTPSLIAERTLFRGDIDAIEVIRLRELYNELEETIDAAEDAADVIERILATS